MLDRLDPAIRSEEGHDRVREGERAETVRDERRLGLIRAARVPNATKTEGGDPPTAAQSEIRNLKYCNLSLRDLPVPSAAPSLRPAPRSTPCRAPARARRL